MCQVLQNLWTDGIKHRSLCVAKIKLFGAESFHNILESVYYGKSAWIPKIFCTIIKSYFEFHFPKFFKGTLYLWSGQVKYSLQCKTDL